MENKNGQSDFISRQQDMINKLVSMEYISIEDIIKIHTETLDKEPGVMDIKLTTDRINTARVKEWRNNLKELLKNTLMKDSSTDIRENVIAITKIINKLLSFYRIRVDEVFYSGAVIDAAGFISSLTFYASMWEINAPDDYTTIEIYQSYGYFMVDASMVEECPGDRWEKAEADKAEKEISSKIAICLGLEPAGQ